MMRSIILAFALTSALLADDNSPPYGWSGNMPLPPAGGLTGQVMAKSSGTDFQFEWITPGGSGTVTSIPDGATNGVSWTVVTRTTTPTFTFTLGDITPSKVNGNTITTGTGTLTIGAGKTFTASNTVTLTATDGSTLAVGAGGTLGSAAYTASSAYEVPLTFSTGLTRSTNTITVNTSQNIATLSNLTSNGFVKTGGGVGTLSVDTTAYAPLASPTFTGTVVLPNSTALVTPVLGVASATSLAASAAVTSSGTAGVGYATGAGGTVTQATNKTTGVTLNKTCGQITMNNAALAAAAEVAFTLTNSTIAATDVVVVNVASVGTAGAYFVTVGAVAAGSCSITVGNCSAGSLSQAIVLNFAVIKGVSS